MEVHFPYQSNRISFVHDSPWGINMIHISALNESVLVKVIHFDPFKPLYITLYIFLSIGCLHHVWKLFISLYIGERKEGMLTDRMHL